MIQLLPKILITSTTSLLLSGMPLSAAESNSRDSIDVKTRAKLGVAKSIISAGGALVDTSADESTLDEPLYLFDDDSDKEYDCDDLLIGVALGEVQEQYTLIEGTTSYDGGGCSE